MRTTRTGNNVLRFLMILSVGLLCSFAKAADAPLSEKALAIHMNVMAERQAELGSLRNTQTYRRVHKICSSSWISSRLVYAFDGMKQGLSLYDIESHIKNLVKHGFFQKAYDLAFVRHFLSPTLAFDLEQIEFNLALDDCGFDEDDKNQFVLDLVVLNWSGSLLGVTGGAKALKLASRPFKFLLRKAPVTTITASALGVIYRIFQNLETGDVNENSQPANGALTITVENAGEKLDLSAAEQSLYNVNQAEIKMNEAELAAIQEKIAKARPDELPQLNQQAIRVEAKLSLLRSGG